MFQDVWQSDHATSATQQPSTPLTAASINEHFNLKIVFSSSIFLHLFFLIFIVPHPPSSPHTSSPLAFCSSHLALLWCCVKSILTDSSLWRLHRFSTWNSFFFFFVLLSAVHNDDDDDEGMRMDFILYFSGKFSAFIHFTSLLLFSSTSSAHSLSSLRFFLHIDATREQVEEEREKSFSYKFETRRREKISEKILPFFPFTQLTQRRKKNVEISALCLRPINVWIGFFYGCLLWKVLMGHLVYVQGVEMEREGE